MPNDEVHIKWAWRAVALGAALMYYIGIDISTVIICGVLVMFFTMYWSPDLDLTCKAYYRWGVLRILLVPFVKFVPHRGTLSHHPIIGPLAMTIYFIAVVGVLNWVFMKLWLPIILPAIDKAQEMHTQIVTLDMSKETMTTVLIVIGCLWFAAWVHYALDYAMKGDRQA